MRRKKPIIEKHNTKAAILFVIFVLSIIVISAAIKLVSEIRESKFDGNNRFTINVLTDKKFKVLSFSPNNQSISILTVNDGNKNLKLGQYLKIPIDGIIEVKSDLIKSFYLEENKDVSSSMSNILFNYNKIKTDLTIIDILRLVLVSKTTPEYNIKTYSIAFSLEEQKVDKIVARLFKDEEIEKENKSVEIINTTQVMGLGGRLAKLITNMGGNVIQVSTENSSQKESIILYNNNKSYTIEKLSKVLGFKTLEMNRQSIADITIIVGEDNKNPLKF